MTTDRNKRPRQGTIRRQLIWGNFILLALLLLSGVILLWQGNLLNDETSKFQDISTRKVNAIRVQHASVELISLISRLGLTNISPSIEEEINTDLTQLEIVKYDFVTAYDNVDQSSEAYLIMLRTNDRVETIIERVNAVIDLAYQNQWSTVSSESSFLVQEQDLLIADINRLVELSDQAQTEISIEAASALNAAVIYPTILIVLALLFASYLIWTTNRNISRSVEQMTAVVNELATGSLDKRVAIESENEFGKLAQTLNTMADQIQTAYRKLEKRVSQRTQDLEEKARQLQATAELGHTAATLRDLNELLSQVVHLISDRFGFYHTGIFLVDEAGESAVLRAANSEGGQKMLERGHQLRVGAEGIVGYVTSQREARIALDVGRDAVFFDNPDLPDTRSEMALPLIVGDQLLGVLDVQSTEPSAFSEEDVSTLMILADQIAVAIENAQLFTVSHETLEETRRAYGELTHEAWTNILQTQSDLNFLAEPGSDVRSTPRRWTPEMIQAINRRDLVQSDEHTLAIPIILRDHVLGVVRMRKPTETIGWQADEIELINTLVDQVEVALESARLYSETQKRAQRERMVTDITTKIRANTDPQAMLQTAVQELRQALQVRRAQVLIQPGMPKAVTPSKDGELFESQKS
jgi:GAF domain-containing protein/HAMP domain-containing protein